MARAGGRDRGLFQKNGVSWVRWTCRYGHEHRERSGSSKSLARQLYQTRKTAVRHSNFCLSEARQRLKREESSSFDKVSERYLEWSREHRPRSMSFREVSIRRLSESFGTRQLSSITGIRLRRDDLVSVVYPVVYSTELNSTDEFSHPKEDRPPWDFGPKAS
jgi:hypothetical protein